VIDLKVETETSDGYSGKTLRDIPWYRRSVRK
jgi:hypothetical protein